MWSVPEDYDGDYGCSRGRPFLWNMVVVEGYKNPNSTLYNHLYNATDGFESLGPHPPGPPYDRSILDFLLSGKMRLNPGEEGGVEATLCVGLFEEAELKEPETEKAEKANQ